MKISIRNFLLLNLLLAVTVTTTLTVIGNYYLDQHDIQEHLDSMLVQNSLAIQALIGDNNEKHDIEMIQKHLHEIPKLAQHLHKLSKNGPEFDINYQDSFQFQVWDPEGKLIIHSANAPELPELKDTLGFQDLYLRNQPWRIYTFKKSRNQMDL